jgi:hypothetical protein
VNRWLARWRQAVAVGVVATALLAVPVGPASAHDESRGAATFEDQKVVELTKAGKARGAAGLGLHLTHAKKVTANNAAVAYTACDDCRAVSLSFQVVVADRGPKDITANNVAAALTEGCTGCESLAVAYQLVIATSDRAKLSARGQSRLQAVRHELRHLARSGKPLLEIHAEAQTLMASVTTILTEELRTRPVIRKKECWDRGEPTGHPRRGRG